ncbi:MAG: hypothetical protein LLG04_02000 [Parachlamydia sp.]|nr:hypothetical protein [Parachlamydia sp.]
MHKAATLALLGLTLFGTSCSVAMAARKEGVSIDKVQTARTRGQILACGATVISSDRMPTGELVEVYQFQKERGSAARALMHGLLDVSTFGIWEAVGTPIEACDTREYFTLRIYYNLDETVNKVELM